MQGNRSFTIRQGFMSWSTKVLKKIQKWWLKVKELARGFQDFWYIWGQPNRTWGLQGGRMFAWWCCPHCFPMFITINLRTTEIDLWLAMVKTVYWEICDYFQWMALGQCLNLILNQKMRKFNFTLRETVAVYNWQQKVAGFLYMWIKKNTD